MVLSENDLAALGIEIVLKTKPKSRKHLSISKCEEYAIRFG